MWAGIQSARSAMVPQKSSQVCSRCGRKLEEATCYECFGKGRRRHAIFWSKACDACGGKGTLLRCPVWLNHFKNPDQEATPSRNESVQPSGTIPKRLDKKQLGKVRGGGSAFGRDTAGFDTSGRDAFGRDRFGRDRAGFDSSGRDAFGRDRSGRDRAGFDRSGRDAFGRDRFGKR